MSLTDVCASKQPFLDSISSNPLTSYDALSSNSLRKLLQKGDYTSSAYNSSVASTTIIWYFLGAIAIIIYLSAVANGIWMRRFTDKAVGFWSFCRRPRTQRNKKRYLFAGILFCGTCLLASIVGASIANNKQENGDIAACGMLDLFNQAINGNQSQNWGGVHISQISYNQLRDRLSDEVDKINVTFSQNTTLLDASLQTYEANFDLLYKTRTNYYVKSARYTDASTVTIATEFINNLGPKEQNGTYLNSLLEESNTLSTTVQTSASSLDPEVQTLKQNKDTLFTNATTAAEGYSNFTSVLTETTQDMSNYITAHYDTWKNLVKAVDASFSVYIALTLVLLITIIIHYKKRSQLAIQTTYIAWHLLMIWTIVSFFLAANLQALRKRSIEQCDIFNLLETDSSFYDQLHNQYPAAFPKTLETCFLGQGETYQGVGFEDGTLLLSNISQYIKDIEPFVVGGPGSLENIAQQQIMDLYIQGLMLVSNDSTDPMGPLANLAILTSWTNYKVENSSQGLLSQCKVSQDTWVINATNCTTAGSVFQSTYSPTTLFGSDLCLGIYSLDAGTISQRYSEENLAGCNPVNSESLSEIIINNYGGLNRHFDDVRRKFRFLQDYYTYNLEDRYQDVLQAATELTNPIQALNQTFGDYLDYISGEVNGILHNANCSLFKQRILAINPYLCDFGSNIKSTLIALTLATMCGIISGILVYLYFRKLETYFRLIEDDSRPTSRASSRTSLKVSSINQIAPEPTVDTRITLDKGSLTELEATKDQRR